jgi:signal transduction histidine kinase
MLASIPLGDVPAALLMLGPDDLIVAQNERARDVVGEVVGQQFAGLFEDQQVAGDGLRGGRRIARVRRDGDVVVVGFTAEETEGGARVVVFSDITQVERLKAERDRLLRLAIIADLLPAVLHEVKNPLAAVTSVIEVALDEDQGMAPQLQRDLHTVLGELRRMRLTLDGVGIAGRELRSDRPGAVDHAVADAVRVLAPRARDLGIVLDADIQTMPLQPFSPDAFRAIVFNLVQNALQASRAGGVVHVALGVAGGVLRLTVEDDGAGMPPDILARCRELFFTTKTRGSGIGLALVDRLVADAGGAVDIDSVVGAGTRIHITLPTTAAAVVAPAPAMSSGASPPER